MRSPLNAGVHKNSTVPAARCDKVWKMTLRREPQETCGDLVLPANFRDCFRVTDQSEIRHSKFHGKFLFYQKVSMYDPIKMFQNRQATNRQDFKIHLF